MKLSVIFISTAVSMIIAAPAVSAADRDNRLGDARFERLDADKDGKVTQEEMLARTSERFDRADADGDGEISVDEMVQRIERRRLERRARRLLDRMDFNGDGKVTKDEIESRAKKRFALMDRNDDGVVEKTEMRQSKRWQRGKKRRYHRRKHRDL